MLPSSRTLADSLSALAMRSPRAVAGILGGLMTSRARFETLFTACRRRGDCGVAVRRLQHRCFRKADGGTGRHGADQTLPRDAPRRRRRARRFRGRQHAAHEVVRPRRLLVQRQGSQGFDDRDADGGAGRRGFGAGDAHERHDRGGHGRGRIVGRPAGRELRQRAGDRSTTRRNTPASRSRPRSPPDRRRRFASRSAT